MFRRSPRLTILLLVMGLVVAAGCSRSPEAKKARHLERADRYFAREQYQDAAIEYQRAVRIDAKDARAMTRVGLSFYQLGAAAQAFPYFVKSLELDPGNAEVRLKLGTIYLQARQPEKAWEQATLVLEKDPKSLDSVVLLAKAATTPGRVDEAIRRVEGLRADLATTAKLPMALGQLYVRKGDRRVAEQAFQEAVGKEPKSIEAHMSLGEFYEWQRDYVQAEREYRAAAGLAPLNSMAPLKLAEFLAPRKPDEAKQLLGQITQKAPDYLPAWRGVAQVAFVEGNLAESDKAIGVILKKNPGDLEGHLLRGRIYRAQRKSPQAIQEFQTVLKIEPRLARARYELALTYLQAGNVQQARAELKEATTLDPNLTDAVLLLAELDIQAGAFQPAIEALEQVVAKHPNEVRAYILLGSAYRAKREPAKATEVYRKIVATFPKDPRGPYLVGVGLRGEGKADEAKKQLEAALALSPGLVDAMGQLVGITFSQKRPDVALERVKRQIALVPSSAELYELLGKVYLARRELDLAESAFSKALELDPNLFTAYSTLGQLYAAVGKDEQALAKLDEAVKRDPRNLVAYTMAGMIHARKGDTAKAERAYQQALAVNPRFAPAANNLAYLYSERGGDKDKEKALQLAQTAKEAAPDDPAVSDTLGWILYKRGVYQRALALLQESATKVPDNPEVQYHLGMVHYKRGNKEAAKQALSRALALNQQFSGAEEARRVLAALK